MGDNYWTTVFRKRVSRRQAMRSGAVAGLGLAGLAAGFGCSDTTQQRTEPAAQATPSAVAQPKYGGTLKWYQATDPPHFDPHLNIASNLLAIVTMSYGRLFKKKAGPDAKPVDIIWVPDLAESWEQPDPLTYVFKLRKGVKWQNVPPLNGREFVADDVVFSFTRLWKEGTPYRYMWDGEADKVEAVDKYTVKFTTKQPYGAFFDYVNSPFCGYIIPREVLEADGDAKQRVIGTGQFILDSYKTGAGYFLKKNPDYYNSKLPYLDRIEIAIVPDSSTVLAAARGRQIDIVGFGTGGGGRLELVHLASLQQTNPDINPVSWPIEGVQGLTFDNSSAPFTDKRVRQAMALSIDRDAVIRSLHSGRGENQGAIPIAMGDWSLPIDKLGEGAKFFKRDVKEAKRLLAEAGFPNGFKTTISTTKAYGDAFIQMTEIFQGFLEEIGIQAETKIWEYAAWLTGPIGGKLEGVMVDPLNGYEFPDPYLFGRYVPGLYYNRGRVNDPKLTEMVTAQRRELNKEKRKQIVWDIQKYLAEQCYLIPIPVGMNTEISQPYVKNFHPLNGRGKEWIESVWLNK